MLSILLQFFEQLMPTINPHNRPSQEELEPLRGLVRPIVKLAEGALVKGIETEMGLTVVLKASLIYPDIVAPLTPHLLSFAALPYHHRPLLVAKIFELGFVGDSLLSCQDETTLRRVLLSMADSKSETHNLSTLYNSLDKQSISMNFWAIAKNFITVKNYVHFSIKEGVKLNEPSEYTPSKKVVQLLSTLVLKVIEAGITPSLQTMN